MRRSAVDTLTGVEDKIKKRIEKQKGLNEQSAVEEKAVQTPGEHAEKTVAGKRVKHSSKSIVEPYRETVIKMWRAGGNHRTIYPVLQAEGYAGSKNAIYQYILKLGKESPEEMSRERKQKAEEENPEEGNFDLSKAESRPDLSLENVARNNVYKAILKEASKQREQANAVPPAGEAPDDKALVKTGSKKRGTRPAPSGTSQFKEELLDLIYGPELEPDSTSGSPEKNGGKKNLI